MCGEKKKTMAKNGADLELSQLIAKKTPLSCLVPSIARWNGTCCIADQSHRASSYLRRVATAWMAGDRTSFDLWS